MDKMKPNTMHSPEEGQPKSTKRGYRAPALTEYGTLPKLTQTMAGAGTDGGLAGSTMTCL